MDVPITSSLHPEESSAKAQDRDQDDDDCNRHVSSSIIDHVVSDQPVGEMTGLERDHVGILIE